MRDRRFADPKTSLLEPLTLVPIEQYRVPTTSQPDDHPPVRIAVIRAQRTRDARAGGWARNTPGPLPLESPDKCVREHHPLHCKRPTAAGHDRDSRKRPKAALVGPRPRFAHNPSSSRKRTESKFGVFGSRYGGCVRYQGVVPTFVGGSSAGASVVPAARIALTRFSSPVVAILTPVRLWITPRRSQSQASLCA